MTQSFRQASTEVLPLSGMDIDVRPVELLLRLRRLLLFLTCFRGH